MSLGFNSEILNEDEDESFDLIGMSYREYLSVNPHIDSDTLDDYFDHMEEVKLIEERRQRFNDEGFSFDKPKYIPLDDNDDFDWECPF